MDPEAYVELTTIFPAWLAFNWIPDNAGIEESDHWPEEPVALHYLKTECERIDSNWAKFIEAACAQPYSFYMVVQSVPGKYLDLKDLFLGTRVRVTERQASKDLKKGCIIYSRVVTLSGHSIMVGCAPVVFPASSIDVFIRAREELKKGCTDFGIQTLHEYDLELREIYFAFREEILNPRMPELQNTDGEPLQLIKLIYELKCPPREALEALASLSLSKHMDELLQDAGFDVKGELQSFKIPWLKKGNRQISSLQNTLLGHISVDGGQLTIDVNSQERADKIQRILKRRLGKRAVFRNAVFTSTEKILEELRNSPPSPGLDIPRETDTDWKTYPEIQQKLREMSDMHWKEWLDTPLPALENQTPREAAKDPIGKELLEALLLDFESRDSLDNPMSPDVAALKEILGLD